MIDLGVDDLITNEPAEALRRVRAYEGLTGPNARCAGCMPGWPIDRWGARGATVALAACGLAFDLSSR